MRLVVYLVMQNEINNLQAALAAYNTAEDQLYKITKEQVVALFQPFFEANPKVDAVYWNQYTPYFMDGEPCVFSVNEISLVSKELFKDACGTDAESYYNSDNMISEWDADEQYRPLFDAANAIRNPLPDKLLQNVFGDHAAITISRDGTLEVDECSHD